MSRTHIRFSADILRRLGEELNPHLDKGVVELVKNSYDADATWCRVELLGTDRGGGAIKVTDNGDGMTPAEIERGWLVLGSSTKDAARLTRLGRIPAGSKGLGRLAALRVHRSGPIRQSALDWMANRRLEAAEQRRTRARGNVSTTMEKAEQVVRTAIGNLPPSSRMPLEAAFKQYHWSSKREADTLRKEAQLYRTLSTAGITAATFAHESSGNPIKVIRQSIDALARRARKMLGDRYEDSLGRPVTGIQRAVRSLAVLGNATLRLLDHDKRRLARVDLHDVVREVVDTFRPFLDGRNVAATVRLCPGAPYVRGSRAAVESIVTNILNNSLTAFESAGTMGRRIELATSI